MKKCYENQQIIVDLELKESFVNAILTIFDMYKGVLLSDPFYVKSQFVH